MDGNDGSSAGVVLSRYCVYGWCGCSTKLTVEPDSTICPACRTRISSASSLASAKLPGAESTLVIKYGHQLYDSDETIAEVVRILHADIGSGEAGAP